MAALVNFVNLVHFGNLVLATLVHFSSFGSFSFISPTGFSLLWSILDHFGSFSLIWLIFCSFWFILIHFGSLWLIWFSLFWFILVHLVHFANWILAILAHFASSWLIWLISFTIPHYLSLPSLSFPIPHYLSISFTIF